MAALPAAGYSILRVKRKRHDDPLQALYIETDQNPSKKPKKRDTTGTGAGIFRFAATVELDSFEDTAETQRLEDCITSLVRSATARESPINAAFAKQQRHAKYRYSAAQARYRVIQERRGSIDGGGSEEDEPLAAGRESYSKGLGRARPTKTSFVKIWDAVEETYQVISRQPRAPDGGDMDTFNEMLAEYLKVSDDVQSKHAPSPARSDLNGNIAEPDDESSYVYDVYYRTKTPMPGEGGTESYGTLSGLKASDLVEDMSGESDSEPTMTDDEDSNEEDFYRNDYPEGEDSSEPEEEVPDPWGRSSAENSEDDL